ncbi:MAG: 50S ribosomal protein L24 [Puniceicoccales bacterium]|jgi:large subunit ribosomal protein L24|nr:50S ribosomal protein L24 [Puniceicoccales bacterium]
MSKNIIKKGDEVVVISGKNKGRSGEVLEVLPAKVAKTKAGLPRPRTSTGPRYLVAGINLVKHHDKKQGNDEAGIHEREAPLPRAKLALLATYKGKKPEGKTAKE